MVELCGNPQRVMAVFAHPDDAELLCFGFLKRLAQAGASIKIVIVSDGSKGVAVGKHAPHDLPLIRMDETQAALAGVTGDVLTLSQPDGVLRMDADLMTNIETMILRHRPELVVSHYVDPMGIDHNDHRVIGAAEPTPPHPGTVWSSCLSFVSANAFSSLSGLFPWTPSQMTGNLLKFTLETVGGSISPRGRAWVCACAIACFAKYRASTTPNAMPASIAHPDAIAKVASAMRDAMQPTSTSPIAW